MVAGRGPRGGAAPVNPGRCWRWVAPVPTTNHGGQRCGEYSLSLSLSLAACRDHEALAPGARPEESVAIQHYGMDAVFDSVAADEPAFAGSYLGPDGRMVLSVARGGVLRNVSHVIEGVAPLRRRSELGRPEFLMSSMDAPTVQTVDYTTRGRS